MSDRLHARIWGLWARLPLWLRWVLTIAALVLAGLLVWRVGEAVVAFVAVLLGIGGGGAAAVKQARRARRDVHELRDDVVAGEVADREARDAHRRRVADIVSGPPPADDDPMRPLDFGYLDEPEVR